MTRKTQEIFTERLNALIEQKLESPSGKKRFNAAMVIAKAVERSQSAVRKWLSGDGLPDVEPLMDLCAFLECTPNYLLGIEDEPSSSSATKPADGLPSSPFGRIPILAHKKQGWVCSGFAAVDSLFNLPDQGDSFFFFNAPSDSMWPTIRINELVLVKSGITAFEENEILLVYFDGSLAIRRMQRRFGACAVMSDNKEHYPEVSVDHQRIHFLQSMGEKIMENMDIDSEMEDVSAIDLVMRGTPLLEILRHFDGMLIVIGQVTSAVRSFTQMQVLDDFPSRSH